MEEENINKENNKVIPKLEEYIPTKIEKVFGIISLILMAIYIILNTIASRFLIENPQDLSSLDPGLMLGLLGISFLTIIVLILLFIFPVISMKGKLKRDAKEYKTNFKEYIKYVLLRFLLAFGVFCLANYIINTLSGLESSANQAMLKSMSKILSIPIALLFGPFVEEFVFRGLLRRIIKNNTWLFVIVSAILFGFSHTLGSEITLARIFIGAIPYSIFGGFLAYYYAKSDNIWNNIIIHFINNLIGVIVLFII